MTTVTPLVKSPTGIAGFDAMTGGGLPHSRTTVLGGAPGAGKTVFAVQSLVANAAGRGDAGIFVGFEESGAQVLSNYASFGWNLPALIEQGKLYLIDGRQSSDVICTGEFTLAGLLAAVHAKAQAMRATHIVFDSIDLLLNMLDNPSAQKREIYRIHDWLSGSGMTGLLTVRTAVD
ncbi:MAG TPA: ATPase domain-containing protein, partial [Burkholderiaceae bacterium]